MAEKRKKYNRDSRCVIPRTTKWRCETRRTQQQWTVSDTSPPFDRLEFAENLLSQHNGGNYCCDSTSFENLFQSSDESGGVPATVGSGSFEFGVSGSKQ